MFALATALIIAVALAAAVVRIARLAYKRSRVGRPGRRARAAGHPSVPRRLTRGERRELADDAYSLLAECGMLAEYTPSGTAITARGEDGNYLLTVGPTLVTVSYGTNRGVEHLGRGRGVTRAVRLITTHAGVPSIA